MKVISIIGLGYVGLPVAVAFSKKFKVIGFDKNESRISELLRGHDRNNEFTDTQLSKATIHYTNNPEEIKQATFHIIAVPTPIDSAKRPDLTILENASALVGQYLKKGDIAVYESTVYPGVTEEFCKPILEKASGLKAGEDFNIGYSPERINPGDKAHQFENIVKVVSGDTPEATHLIARTYASVISAGVHRAPSIKVAEAAKVIENTQRDLNIALMNELAIIFDRIGIDTHDVLEAASTKWNFLNFTPGLVGGHCIGVDPYYLTHKAEQVNYHPQVILAGRRINDNVSRYIVENTLRLIHTKGVASTPPKIGVLGITFKENCPDTRNSKVVNIIEDLRSYGFDPLVHDPMANPEEVYQQYGIELSNTEAFRSLDVLIAAVPHQAFQKLILDSLSTMVRRNGIVIDIKNMIDRKQLEELSLNYWRL